MPLLRPWKVLHEKNLDKRGPFTLVSSLRENPRNSITTEFLRIDCIDWAGTIPVTSDGRVVLVRQYRHGIDHPCLEIPAGCVHEDDENFSMSARRELLEETGYDSEEFEFLGFVHPNPGMMPVKCHIYLSRNVVRIRQQALDDGEDIEVVLQPLREIPRMIQSGEITHSMIISAFALLMFRYPGMLT